MKLTYLYGVHPRDWWRLLRENRFAVSPWCAHHAALITVLSLVNGGLARRDAQVEGAQAPVREPLFILGHWRSGTTHLQYLLDQDEALASPSTYDVSFPNSALCGQHTHGRLLGRFLPETRPQDELWLTMAAPNEDEIGLAALGIPTPYLYYAFPANEAHYMRFLTFLEASEAERRAFVEGLDQYLRRLSHKYGRRLVLKSPPHTARIAMLLERYPDARFVHLTRDPYAVFASTRHLHQTYYTQFAPLQRYEGGASDDRILGLYREMYDAFFDQVTTIAPGRLHELRCEDLEADPVGALRTLYSALDLPDFPEGRVRAYVEAHEGFRKNRYPPLTAAERARVATEWARNFEAWGYPT